jgi:hypothetical protein
VISLQVCRNSTRATAGNRHYSLSSAVRWYSTADARRAPWVSVGKWRPIRSRKGRSTTAVWWLGSYTTRESPARHGSPILRNNVPVGKSDARPKIHRVTSADPSASRCVSEENSTRAKLGKLPGSRGLVIRRPRGESGATILASDRKVGSRSNTVLTYQGSEVIVPNSNLISNQVINWTLATPWRRGKYLLG